MFLSDSAAIVPACWQRCDNWCQQAR